MKILIIGGTGAFGAFYAKRFTQAGFSVAITGRHPETGKPFCEKNGLTWDDGADLSKFDAVIVSVPNEAAPTVIKKLAPKLSKGTLLFDLCSVKKEVVKELSKLKKKNLELASLHPMHGPRINSIAGVPIVCVPIKIGKKLEQIKKFFIEQGANFFESTAEEHDNVIAIVQGLTHYTQFVAASVVKETGINLKDTLKFSTPNYSLFLSSMARVVLQNPELYSQIQLSNPNNEKIRKLFSKKAKELENLCKKNSAPELQKFIISKAQIFKDPEAFLVESDKAANSFNYIVAILKSSVGSKIVVENLLTHSFHYGLVKEATAQDLVLIEGNKETKLSISKLRLLTKLEASEWKKKSLEERHLDFSFLVPQKTIPDALLPCLSSTGEFTFELIDQFSGPKLPQGHKSLTIRVHFFSDEDKKTVDAKVKELITGLGFELR